MVEGVPQAQKDGNKLNPVKEEPVIPSARVQESKVLSEPEVLEILESEIPEPVKPRDTSAEIKINVSEISPIDSAIALTVMGAASYIARNEYVDEAPVKKDELTQAEIDAENAENDLFTGNSSIAQEMRLRAVLRGEGEMLNTVNPSQSTSGSSSSKTSMEEILLQNMVWQNIQQAVTRAIEDSGRVRNQATKATENATEVVAGAEKMQIDTALRYSEERQKLQDLNQAYKTSEAAGDTAKMAEIRQQIEEQNVKVQHEAARLDAGNELFTTARTRVDARVEEINRDKERLAAQEVRLKERMESANIDPNNPDQMPADLRAELDELNRQKLKLEQQTTVLNADAQHLKESMETFHNAMNDNKLSRDEIQILIYKVPPGVDADTHRQQVMEAVEKARQRGTEVEGWPSYTSPLDKDPIAKGEALANGTYWETLKETKTAMDADFDPNKYWDSQFDLVNAELSIYQFQKDKVTIEHDYGANAVYEENGKYYTIDEQGYSSEVTDRPQLDSIKKQLAEGKSLLTAETRAEFDALVEKKRDAENLMGVCRAPGATTFREAAYDSDAYKQASAAEIVARTALEEGTQNTVKLEGDPNLVVYRENGEYIVRMSIGDEVTDYKVSEMTESEQQRYTAQINEQIAAGKSLGTSQTLALQHQSANAVKHTDTVLRNETNRLLEANLSALPSQRISSTTSAANQADTPGEPLNVPDMNSHFTAAAQPQPTLTNGLGQNLNASNDPNFNRGMSA